jgi:hypothetical protein
MANRQKRNARRARIRHASTILKRKEKLDPYLIFYQGCQFMIASEHLNEIDASMRVFRLPSNVMSAFSSELFLKCLMVMAGKDPRETRTHDLDELFKEIGEQSRVLRLWDASWQEFVVRQFSERKDFVPLNAPDLYARLEGGGDAFDLFRYLYEQDGVIALEVGPLPRVLAAAILEIHPEWEERFETDAAATRNEDLSIFKQNREMYSALLSIKGSSY